MQFNIDDVRDIGKLLGQIRLLAKGEFKINKECFDDVLMRLNRLAKEKGINIQIISPDGKRLLEFTVGGAIIGAAAGFYFGHIPGALLGAAAGGMAGYYASHTKLILHNSIDKKHYVLKIV